MRGHFVQVEQSGAEDTFDRTFVIGFIADDAIRMEAKQPAGRRRTKLRHDRHQIAGPSVAIDNAMVFSKQASVDRMRDPVSQVASWMLQKRARKKLRQLLYRG